LINSVIETEGIRLLSIEDIVPMKLSAIANRGAKRDFYDIFFLLNHLSIKEMLSLFSRKFSQTNHFYLLKSLTYFDDAEEEANPKVFAKISWEQVKTKIEETVNELI
jgi:predicted nucleotidyltransferase component of viral defense system